MLEKWRIATLSDRHCALLLRAAAVRQPVAVNTYKTRDTPSTTSRIDSSDEITEKYQEWASNIKVPPAPGLHVLLATSLGAHAPFDAAALVAMRPSVEYSSCRASSCAVDVAPSSSGISAQFKRCAPWGHHTCSSLLAPPRCALLTLRPCHARRLQQEWDETEWDETEEKPAVIAICALPQPN